MFMVLNCFKLRTFTGIAALVGPQPAAKTPVGNAVVLAESILAKQTTAG